LLQALPLQAPVPHSRLPQSSEEEQLLWCQQALELLELVLPELVLWRLPQGVSSLVRQPSLPMEDLSSPGPWERCP
jgi:hypothetical protein